MNILAFAEFQKQKRFVISNIPTSFGKFLPPDISAGKTGLAVPYCRLPAADCEFANCDLQAF